MSLACNVVSWKQLALLACVAFVPALSDARGNDEEAPAFTEEQLGEYNRLSERMQRLAEKTTWAGVERIFLQMEEAAFPMSQRDYLLGAEAARDVGDMKHVRDRLLEAMRVEADLSTGRSLAEIQGNYGAVILTTKAKGGETQLLPEMRPFQPDRAKAIDYAAAQLAETGTFDGLLPVGKYTFGKKAFEIEAGHEPVEINVGKR